MNRAQIIEQGRVMDVLERAISSERIAHAYLFHGPKGIGKRAVALAFAQSLLCNEPGPSACGQCDACRKVDHMVHPDLHVYFPYPTDTSTSDIAERLSLLARDPYAEIGYGRRPSLSDPGKSSNKQALYTVKRINEEIKRAMAFRAHHGRYKIALILDADAFRIEAANAFLKVLEEPSPHTVFILTTSRMDRILPTILSRCQQLRLDLLSSASIEQALIDRKGIPAKTASPLARMAAGSYTRAQELAANESLMEQRALVVHYFRKTFINDRNALTDVIETLQSSGRSQVRAFLQLLQTWIQDLIHFKERQEEAQLVNIDQVEPIRNFCHRVPGARMDVMFTLVEEAIYLLDRNVHLLLLLEVLATALHRAMQGQERIRIVADLADPQGALMTI